jgi:2-C-methyl-D-erythritol 4-phosphate cytidylyltransferase
MPSSATALIAAAGSGERLGAGVPKAFVPLAGRPMIEWSIEAIVVAAPPGHLRDLAGGTTAGDDPGSHAERELHVVSGGATRAQSVANGLEAVDTELVAIHDAARPLVTPHLVEEVVACLEARPDAAGAIPAAPVSDTIKRGARTSAALALPGVDGAARVVERTLDRTALWAAQTPQVFRTGALRAALEVEAEVRDAATDEAMLVESAGGTVLIHEASPQNLKVTTALDLRLAELLLGDRPR